MYAVSQTQLSMQVAKRIAYLRAAGGVTQDELARRLGIALKNLQRLESGRQNLTLGSIERVATALRVDWRDFFVGEPAGQGGTVRRAVSTARRLDGLVGPGRVLVPVGEDPPPQAVPVTTLVGAATRLRAGRKVEPTAWVILGRTRPPEGAFIARILGGAMVPALADGAWALFAPPDTRSLVGRVVLIARSGTGEGGAQGYLLKRVASAEPVGSGKLRVTLQSDNPSFAPIVLEVRSLDDLRVVGVFVRTLSASPA